MKKLTLIFTLLFSTVMFSSSSYADWTKISSNEKATIYIDLDTITHRDGYVYWWDLSNLSKPGPQGILSAVTLRQGDCNLFRYKVLSDRFYSKPMGRGSPFLSSDTPDKHWRYTEPNDTNTHKFISLKLVCNK